MGRSWVWGDILIYISRLLESYITGYSLNAFHKSTATQLPGQQQVGTCIAYLWQEVMESDQSTV